MKRDTFSVVEIESLCILVAGLECNAVLGMGKGIFMFIVLGDNSLAKTGA